MKNTGWSPFITITVYVYNASGDLVLTSEIFPGYGGTPPGQAISDVFTGALGPGQYIVKLVVQNEFGNIVVAVLHVVIRSGHGHGHWYFPFFFLGAAHRTLVRDLLTAGRTGVRWRAETGAVPT